MMMVSRVPSVARSLSHLKTHGSLQSRNFSGVASSQFQSDSSRLRNHQPTEARWPQNNAFLDIARHANSNSSLRLFVVPSSRHFSVSVSLMNNTASTTTSPATSETAQASTTTTSTASTAPPSASSSEASASASSSAGTEDSSRELVLDFIPEKPTPVQLPEASLGTDGSAIQFIGDPPLQMLGLGSYWPPGRMQVAMEYLHSNLDLPWWGVIAITTCIIRLCVFPLVVKSQRNVALMQNETPKMQLLQQKMTEARRRGDMYDSAVHGQELAALMKEKNINPIKNMMPLLIQFPFFMSMFMGLRGMANLPLESFTNGGLLWFTDLTVADPYYTLPLITSASTFLMFKMSADGVNTTNMGPIAKLFVKAMPVILFPITMNFPAGVTFYWATTNIITLIQAKLLRIQAIREKLKIPKLIQFDKDKLPIKDKGFRETIRETIDNWRVQADIADRRAYDEQAFREAGVGTPRRTYKFDPTKQQVKRAK